MRINRGAYWKEIESQILSGKVDALLISPERLANDQFMTDVLLPISSKIGLFVVDEAHCISDWGHDFRPDYRRIARILSVLPPNLPVLATTATANNRVFDDICAQLGNKIAVQRGPLTRSSLILDAAYLGDCVKRMAWLAEYLPKIPGSGIIYALTVRDTERLASWLRSEGIEAAAYYGSVDPEERVELEEKLLQNKIKALVATSALGMGFDKPDIGFVIHYQTPPSVIHYYQQVGRAGRGIDSALGVLMGGEEDDSITDFFIETAFPPPKDVEAILDALENTGGASIPSLESTVNLPRGQIEKALKILALDSPAPVIRQGSQWIRTPNSYHYDHEKVGRITALRKAEQQQMRDYMSRQKCFMRFLAEALDDINPKDCGKCGVCRGRSVVSRVVPQATSDRVLQFLQRTQIPIEPRKLWPKDGFIHYGFKGKINDSLRTEEGMALCLYGDPVWGDLVKQGKYTDEYFSDQLVAALGEAIRRWDPHPSPAWVTCVPSLKRPELLPDFAARLAHALSLQFSPCIQKVRQNQPQKDMKNSLQQTRNLDGCFQVVPPVPSAPVLLVDDMVDSRWTMTVIAALLRREGVEAVLPVALALNTTDD